MLDLISFLLALLEFVSFSCTHVSPCTVGFYVDIRSTSTSIPHTFVYVHGASGHFQKTAADLTQYGKLLTTYTYAAAGQALQVDFSYLEGTDKQTPTQRFLLNSKVLVNGLTAYYEE